VSDLSPSKVEVLQGQHSAGLKADMMLKAFGTLHNDREKQIINELITFFRAQPWDERTAIRYISALSENRAQQEELEHRARKGVQARAALFGSKTTAD
jgi:hypothetical protein